MSDWTKGAGEDLKVAIETGVFASIYADAAALNSGNTAGKISGSYVLGTSAAPVTLDETNILKYIVDLGSVLGEQDVPREDRWLILPEWACGLIMKSDLKDRNISGDDGGEVLRNGRIGRIASFTVYQSNLLPVVSTNTNIIAGHKSALTFASQLLGARSIEDADVLTGIIVQGWQVYGFKTVKPEAMVHGVVKK
jgi:hypothetical protein